MTDDFARLVHLRDTLKAWALDHAFPLWWQVGADKINGGFFEKIALDGAPVEAPRRARVQPRQIYSYAVAGLLGWGGPWKQALEHGLDFYLGKYRRPDGFMRTLVASDGAPLDDKVDLYDQAFGLFGLAMASSVLPERADLPALAIELRSALYATLKHPVAGFEETHPRTLPLLSNPHMHLFEASLAWIEAGGDAKGDGSWRAMADEIAELALARFIDPKSGGRGPPAWVAGDPGGQDTGLDLFGLGPQACDVVMHAHVVEQGEDRHAARRIDTRSLADLDHPQGRLGRVVAAGQLAPAQH